MDLEKELEPFLYTLIDEEGKEHEFELIDKLEFNDSTYYAMTPTLSNPNSLEDSDGELVLLKSQWDENNEELLATIDNEDENYQVGQKFLERLDLLEFESGDDEED